MSSKLCPHNTKADILIEIYEKRAPGGQQEYSAKTNTFTAHKQFYCLLLTNHVLYTA